MKRARLRPCLAATALVLPAVQLTAQRHWQPLRSLRGDLPISFDTARGRLVRHGGGSGQPKLFEWRGEWLHRDVSAGSDAVNASFAYDAARQNVVMFGGLSASVGWSRQTWLWDGVRWTSASTLNSPPWRFAAAMAFDPLRRRVVLYGGIGGNDYSTRLVDTWLWDGAQWSQPVLTVGPGPRVDAGMAFDRVAGRIVLAGGGSTRDTWQWDGAQWLFVGPTPGAGPHSSMAFDDARGRLVLSDSRPYGGAAFPAVTSVYEWVGQSWVQVPSGSTNTGFSALAYDGVLGSVVCHRGDGRLEAWDGVNWQEVDSGEPRLTLPVVTSDYSTGAVHLVGYRDSVLTTWRWDSRRWIRIAAAASPGGDRFMLATDPSRGLVVMSLIAYGQATNSTWELRGASWQPVPTAAAPSARAGSAMSQGVANRVLLFGGQGYPSGNLLDDTWSYDGTTWTLLQPAHRPSARADSGIATDIYRGRVVLYGGFGGSLTTGDTWEWDGNDWHWRAVVGPGPRVAPACDFDLMRARVVLSSGSDGQAATGGMWEWNGTLWQALPDAAPRGPATMAYDHVHDRHLMVQDSATSAVFEVGTLARATMVGQGCAVSLGVLQHVCDVPVLGCSAFALQVVHAAPGAPSLIAVAGAQQVVALGGGCTSYLATPQSDVFLAVANSFGVAQVPIAVPDDPTLMGAVVFTQAAALDPAGPLGGVSVANAVRLTIGQ